MKRLLILAAAALILFQGCKPNVNTPEIIAQDTQEMTDAIKAIRENADLTLDEKNQQMLACYEAVYNKHAKDSLGMDIFKKLVTNKLWDLETVEAKYAKASDLIKNDELINTKVEAYRNAANVVPGNPYINIEGPSPLTGETVSIADVLAEGKPVIVDFWASWCGPVARSRTTSSLWQLKVRSTWSAWQSGRIPSRIPRTLWKATAFPGPSSTPAAAWIPLPSNTAFPASRPSSCSLPTVPLSAAGSTRSRLPPCWMP